MSRFGRRRYWFEDEATTAIAIQMPEGVYPVQATLQLELLGRPKSKKRIPAWVVDMKVPKGFRIAVTFRVERVTGCTGSRCLGGSRARIGMSTQRRRSKRIS
ncbi:hypothetical protein ACWCPQ_34720 [Nocardia sp. NPDC001965]